LLAVMSVTTLALAGFGAAAFVLVREPADDVPPPEPSAPAAAPATQEEPPAAANTQQQLETALARARLQIAEAKAQARDEETREQLDQAMAQAEKLLVQAKALKQPEAAAEAPAAPAAAADRCDDAAVAKVSKRNIRTIQNCYERALEKSPGLGGKLVLRVGLGAAGAVESAELSEDSMTDAAMKACALSAVRKWAFSAAGRPCTASLTYDFEAK
jgi:TonB family protein